MPSLPTYWRTLRHLKPSQFYGRIYFRVFKPPIDSRPTPPLRSTRGLGWVQPARRRVTMVGPQRFCFLNETHDLPVGDWDNLTVEKLWLYNLHYFDDLNAQDAASRPEWSLPAVGASMSLTDRSPVSAAACSFPTPTRYWT